MSEFRYNILTGEWVIIAADRAKRPMQFSRSMRRDALPQRDAGCPFCPGNEHMTTQEVDRFGSESDWLVRVVKNKYPALEENASPSRGGSLFRTHIDGFGIHEVIIDSPRHDRFLTDMTPDAVGRLLLMYRQRYRFHEKDTRVRHIIIFKNNGEGAGSSLVHPHSQLIATPIVSGQIEQRIETTRQYRHAHGRCLMCDMLREEQEINQRIVYANEEFVAFLPYAALSSFHMWVFPVRHAAHFGNMTDGQARALGEVLSRVLRALEKLLHYPDYNLVVRSAPTGCSEADYHWYISIIPRLSKTAGFEIGSNIYINCVPPEQSALELRNIMDVCIGFPG